MMDTETTTQRRGSAQDASGDLAGFWYFVAVALVAAGFAVMFYYQPAEYSFDGPGFGEIVGGDAYNYIIIATRGVGFICAGVISAVIGLGCEVSALRRATAGFMLVLALAACGDSPMSPIGPEVPELPDDPAPEQPAGPDRGAFGALADGSVAEYTMLPGSHDVSVSVSETMTAPREEIGGEGPMRWESFDAPEGRVGVRIYGVPAGWWYWVSWTYAEP